MPQFVDLRLVEEKHGEAKKLPPKSLQMIPTRAESLNMTLEEELHLRSGGNTNNNKRSRET